MFLKRFQLGLIHVAVAMTLVPINSTLNRVMIKELAISATLVAILASLPYLFSPIQVAIGSYSDRHPIFGFRRTPYILAGLVLCVLGVIVSPQVAFLMHDNFPLGSAGGHPCLWRVGHGLQPLGCFLSLPGLRTLGRKRTWQDHCDDVVHDDRLDHPDRNRAQPHGGSIHT